MSNPADRREPDAASGNSQIGREGGRPRPLRSASLIEAASSDIIRSEVLLIEGRRPFQEVFPSIPTLRQSDLQSTLALIEPEEQRRHISSVSARIIYLLDLLRGHHGSKKAAVIEDLVHGLLSASGFFGLAALTAALKVYGPEFRKASDYAEELVVEAASKSLVELLREQLILDLREHPLGRGHRGPEEPSPADKPEQGLPDDGSLGNVFSVGCFPL